MKKLLSISGVVLVAGAMMLSGSTAYASNDKPATTMKSYRVINGKLTELGFQERVTLDAVAKQHEQKKANAKQKTTVAGGDMRAMEDCIGFCSYDYIERGVIPDYTKSDERNRITPFAANSTSDNITRTLKASTTDTYTINISLNTGKKDALSITVGGSWATARSFEDTVTATVRPGHTGWFDWTPIKRNSYGSMITHWYNELGVELNQTSEWTDLYMTKEIYYNGQSMSDGILDAMDVDYIKS